MSFVDLYDEWIPSFCFDDKARSSKCCVRNEVMVSLSKAACVRNPWISRSEPPFAANASLRRMVRAAVCAFRSLMWTRYSPCKLHD